MGLCGSFRCGCGVTSSPAVSGAINGELPSIVVAGSGEAGDPYDLSLNDAWAAEVVGAIDVAAVGEHGSFTPTLTNVDIGTGGSAANDGRYTWVGGTEVGSQGILSVSGNILLGTSGASVTGAPQVTLPSGFEFNIFSTGSIRVGFATLVSSHMGVVRWLNASSVEFSVLNSSATYLTTAAITATVPATWAAGNVMRYHYSAAAVRV